MNDVNLSTQVLIDTPVVQGNLSSNVASDTHVSASRNLTQMF